MWSVWGNINHLLEGIKVGKDGVEPDWRALGCTYSQKSVLYFTGKGELLMTVEQGSDIQFCI